ncbi:MAG: cytochrome c oxidase accessory protein CcoG [Rhodospirillaceae bacterium]
MQGREDAGIAASLTEPLTGGLPVGKIDVDAVNSAEKRPMYQKRRKIFPRRAHGRFRKLKWAVLCATLGVYYLLPWLRWDRGPNAPDQAVLVDFPGRRFYFFFIEIWPQEIYYVTGLLIIAALALFLVTSIAGRVWCGYACPQTVWTDLFMWVEGLVEGDRNARMRLDKAPWTASKLWKRTLKHGAWIVIGLCTGGAWVFYFADAPTLAAQLLRFDAPLVSYIFIALLTFTTYMLAGHAREQVCTYMCPWPRIQGAMLDENSMLVSYRAWRGEPRGSHKKGESWEGRGDCVDCNSCVVVCPMGIDIRDGNQLECINCALCIDACDEIMDRVGRPLGLIAYDTIAGLEARTTGSALRPKLLRARTLIYAALIAVVGLVMLVALTSRSDTDVNVLRDRNPLFVTLSDGTFRNGYTVKILNKQHGDRRFSVSVDGLRGDLTILGNDGDVVSVGSDRLRSIRVYLTASAAATAGVVTDLDIVVTDEASGAMVRQATTFRRAP